MLIGKLEINSKTFTMDDSEGTVYLKQLGLSDDFYGGYVREFRKTVYGIYMCINRKGEIVNLYYTKDSLTDKGRELVNGVKEPLAKEEVKAEVKAEPIDRKALIAAAKELGVGGNINFMKTNDLINAIKEKSE